jgi:hypothetical protein
VAVANGNVGFVLTIHTVAARNGVAILNRGPAE